MGGGAADGPGAELARLPGVAVEKKPKGRVIVTLDLVGALVWAAILGGVLVLAVIGAVCLAWGR